MTENSNFILLQYRVHPVDLGFSISLGMRSRVRGNHWMDFSVPADGWHPFSYSCGFEIWNSDDHILTVSCRSAIIIIDRVSGNQYLQERIDRTTALLMQYERSQLDPLPYHIEFE